MFVNSAEGDLNLQATSAAIGAGNGVWSYSVPYDINGNYRSDPPCIGAMEYVDSGIKKAKQRNKKIK
jgi:hypothetical protein